MSRDRYSIVINTFSNWLSIATNTMTALLLTPYLVSHLGVEGYGIWVLIMAITGYYGFFDLGLHSAAIRFVAAYEGAKDREALRRTVQTSLLLFSAAGVVVTCLTLLFSGPMAAFFKVKGNQVHAFRYMIYLIGISAGLGFPRRLFDAILQGHERFVVFNVSNCLMLLGRALAMFFVLRCGGGLIGLGFIEFTMEAANIVIKFVLTSRMGVSLSVSAASSSMAKALLGFSIPSFLAILGDTLRLNADLAVVGRILTLHAVGVYGIASTIIKLLLRLSSALTTPTYPRLSFLAARDMAAFRSTYLRYSHICALFVTWLAVEVVLLCEGFIHLWVGPSFAESVPIAVILALSLSTDYATVVSVYALKAVNRQNRFVVQSIGEGLVNLGLSIFLARRMGMIGVALGTAIPVVITKLLIQPVYSSSIIGVRLHQYYMKTVIQPGVAGTMAWLFFHLLGFTHGTSSFPVLVSKGLCIGCVYWGMVFFFCLDRAERAYAKGAAANLLGHARRTQGRIGADPAARIG